MKNKAFTLIETLIGITLITVSLTAVTGLILSTLNANQRNLHTLQALALAEEGLEVVRYLRDSNWLQNYSWDTGWGGSDGLFFQQGACPPCWEFSTQETDGTVIMPNGFSFVRKLSLQSIPDENDPTQEREDTWEAVVTVEWSEKGVDRSVDLSTYLTRWK